jgi:hypothetical protein
MKLRHVALSCLLFFVISSCQKEISVETGNATTGTGGSGGGTGGTGGGGTGTGGDLLVKTVTTSPLETTTMLFVYDANKRLIGNSVNVSGPVSQGDFRRHITRDNTGRIAFVIDSSLQPSGSWEMDSARFYYNGNTLSYMLNVNYDATGVNSNDSVVYVYTGSNITKATSYNLSGGTYTATDEYVYTYDAAGNITNYKWYALGSSTPLQTEKSYTYDAKVSPLKWGAEVVLLNSIEGAIDLSEAFTGPNNATKIEETDHAGGGTKDIYNSTYTYLSNNKPNTASGSVTIGGIPIPIANTTTFYYN